MTVEDVAEGVVEDAAEGVDVGDVDVGRNCLTEPGTASRSHTPPPLCC